MTNTAGTVTGSWWMCAAPGCTWQGSQPCPLHSMPTSPPEPLPQPVWPWNVGWAAQRAYEAIERYYNALTEALTRGTEASPDAGGDASAGVQGSSQGEGPGQHEPGEVSPASDHPQPAEGNSQ